MEKTFGKIMSGIKFSDAELYVIHCFDPRDLWLRIWQSQCPKKILLARIPLAGASAKGKHYLTYFHDHEANVNSPIAFVTHYPCGWYEGQQEKVILDHGKSVVDALIADGRKAIHLHFSLSKESWTISFSTYDPSNLSRDNENIMSMIQEGKSFENQVFSDADLFLNQKIETLVIADEVFGPPVGGPTLVVADGFLIGTTVKIVKKLNQNDEPFLIDSTPIFYEPNYK